MIWWWWDNRYLECKLMFNPMSSGVWRFCIAVLKAHWLWCSLQQQLVRRETVRLPIGCPRRLLQCLDPSSRAWSGSRRGNSGHRKCARHRCNKWTNVQVEVCEWVCEWVCKRDKRERVLHQDLQFRCGSIGI